MGKILGKLVEGRYQVVQVLGAGEFSQTYLAQDIHRTGSPTCVVKHFLPANNHPESVQTLRRLFNREAQTLKQLGNYSLVPQLLAHFEQNQEFYLVQDFIAGHPLSEELLPGSLWTERQVVQLLQEVLGILEFVHSHGLLHRDIKPSNLIRREQDGRLVLIDFSSAKFAWTQVVTTQGCTSTNFALSIPATIAIGTPGYMPPEQDRGRPRPNSDIYALGMIGIQALTGLNPTQLLEDSNTGEMLWQHQAQVSPELASVLNNMVRYHFKDRYQSATEALQALQPLANSHPLEITSTTVARELLQRGSARSAEVPKVTGGAGVPPLSQSDRSVERSGVSRAQRTPSSSRGTLSPEPARGKPSRSLRSPKRCLLNETASSRSLGNSKISLLKRGDQSTRTPVCESSGTLARSSALPISSAASDLGNSTGSRLNGGATCVRGFRSARIVAWNPRTALPSCTRVALQHKAKASHPRRALIIDGLSNSKTTLALCKVLHAAGDFELEYWSQPAKVWSEVRDAIQTCQHQHNASTFLLYLRGSIEEIENGEAWLVLGGEIRLSRSWLRQELGRMGIPQQIVVLDCPGASSLCDWVEELKLGAEQGQCLIAAAAPCDEPERFTQELLETLVAAQPQVGLPVAKWITKLQVKLGIIGLPLHAWLSRVNGVSEILPDSSFSCYLHSSESSATRHSVIEVLPGSSRSVLQDVQKPASSGSMNSTTAQVEPFPCSVCFQEQYSRLEEILKELIGPIAPTLLQRVAAQASSPQAWVENLARYLPVHLFLELQKQSISLLSESTAQPQSKSSHAPSLKHQAITESEVQQCEQALANFIGPIATFLVQNVLKSHPQISTAHLVEILTAEIPDRQKAVEFHHHIQITQKSNDNKSSKSTKENQSNLRWLQANQSKAIALLQLLITPLKKRWANSEQ